MFLMPGNTTVRELPLLALVTAHAIVTRDTGRWSRLTRVVFHVLGTAAVAALARDGWMPLAARAPDAD
jgi:hypothetical protein